MPKHIKYFEWTWLGSLAVGIIVSALSYSEMVPVELDIFDGFILFFYLFIFGIILLLILLTSRKRSNITKWILVVMFGFGIVLYIPQLAFLFNLGFVGVLSSLQLLAQCVGVYFLFTEESREWFRVAKTTNVQMPQNQLMRKCPECSEEVKREARKCKHCGEDLTKLVNMVNFGSGGREVVKSVSTLWNLIWKTFVVIASVILFVYACSMSM